MPRGKQKGKPETIGSTRLICYDQGDGKTAWYCRYRDSDKGRTVEKSLKAASRDKARQLCKLEDRALYDSRLKTKEERLHIGEAPELKPAIIEALKQRRDAHEVSKEHMTSMLNRANYWLDFMKDNFPAVQCWIDVQRTPHVSSYVTSLAKRKLSRVTVRHYLEPLSITSMYYGEEHSKKGYENIRPLRAAPVKKKKRDAEPEKKYLTARQVEKALETAIAVKQWKVALTLHMGCYCGLNLREIVWLRQQDFDLDNSTVKIERAKNEYRPRTIPIPQFVSDYVREHIASQTVRPLEGYLVPPPPGKDPNDGYVSRALVRTLKRAGLDGIIAPKDCRKTFNNLDCLALANEWLLDSYMGRTGTTIGRRHYKDAERPGLWKTHIVEVVEAFREKVRTELRTGQEPESVEA